MPKLYEGRDVTIEFTHDGDFTELSPVRCEALHLPVGATVYSYCRVTAPKKYLVYLFAEGNMAREIRSYPKGTVLKAKAKTKFGTYIEVEHSNNGGVEITLTR